MIIVRNRNFNKISCREQKPCDICGELTSKNMRYLDENHPGIDVFFYFCDKHYPESTPPALERKREREHVIERLEICFDDIMKIIKEDWED